MHAVIISYAKKNKWKILKYYKYYILYHNFTDAFSMSQLELHFDIKTTVMFFQKYEIVTMLYIFLKKPPKPQLQKQSHV